MNGRGKKKPPKNEMNKCPTIAKLILEKIKKKKKS